MSCVDIPISVHYNVRKRRPYHDNDNKRFKKTAPWSKGKDWFYFNSDGVMQTGWITHKGGLYYCDETNGNMLTGSHTMTLQFGKDGGLI